MGEILQIPDIILRGGQSRRKLIFKNLDVKRGDKGMEFPKNGGILTYWEGEKYPWKGFIMKEPVLRGPVDALDEFKSILRAITNFLTSKPIRYLIPLIVVFPRKLRNKIIYKGLETISEIASFTVGIYGIKPELYCQSVREIYRAGIAIIGKPTDDKKGGYYNPLSGLLEGICMFLEFDDTYRLTFQDAFGEINPIEFGKNPKKELLRILDIMIKRDTRITQEDKIKQLKTLLKIGCLLFRKEIKSIFKAMEIIDWEKVKMDEGDEYHSLTRVYYNFKGIDFRTRNSIRQKIDENWNNMKL